MLADRSTECTAHRNATAGASPMVKIANEILAMWIRPRPAASASRAIADGSTRCV